MKKLVVVIGMLSFQACTEASKEELERESKTADAWLVNNLISDGCDLHIRLPKGNDTIQVVPTQETLSVVAAYYERAATDYKGLPVKVEYRETHEKRAISCGWGRQMEFPAVHVESIEAR